ncbi:MAG: hypothetical protein CME06_06495 [Gemmatimonadetes bacterium]|nr:hypothetical protein [Gemmatimonadota bacterium]
MWSVELTWIAWAVAALTLFHAGAALWLIRGMGRSLPVENERPPVSVVVAARDEAEAIGGLVAAITGQDYEGPVELIVVDDRSVDGTADHAQRHAECVGSGRSVRILRIAHTPPGVSPKKHSLGVGIDAARHELLAFTDGDTRPEPTWISAMSTHLGDEVGLVIGPAPIDGAGWLGRVASLEALGLGAVAAGSAGAGYALTCTGRNLLYRRRALADAGGMQASAGLGAGDDDLTMGRLRDETEWRIVHARGRAAAVRGRAKREWGDWIAQRRRHASNSTRFAPRIVAGLGVLYLYHLLPILLVGMGFVAWNPLGCWALAGAAWGVRAAIDWGLLANAARRFGEDPPSIALGIVEPLFSLMVVVVAPLGILRGYSWKGERFPRGKVRPPKKRTI